MFKLLKLEVSDYTVTYSESTGNYYIDASTMKFKTIFINPYCIMTISEVEDKVFSDSQLVSWKDYSLLTLSDGNKYILNKTISEATDILESSINSISLPF